MIAAGQTITSPTSRYLVQGERGRGGFGIAWRATRQTDGHAVVLKELRLDRLADWKAMQLFERDARVMSELSHRGIPNYIEFFGLDEHGAPFEIAGAEPRESFTTVLVQDFIVGQNLEERRRENRRYTPEEIEGLLVSMLEVLTYLHDLNPPVVHRDISPKNIVRSADGGFFLVDFGAIQDRLRSGTMLGSTNVGTFGFIPPEQAMGHTKPASDLFALAMTVLVAGTGRTPEELPLDESTGKVSQQALPSNWRPQLVAALDKMLEPVVGNRVASAREALQLLRQESSSTALVRSSNGRHQVTVTLGRTVQIGRAENVDIRVADPSVSRYHASIAHRTDGRFVVRDLGSARGTWVDGRPAMETALRDGSRLRLGAANFRVLLLGDDVVLTEEGREPEDDALMRGVSGDMAVHRTRAPTMVFVLISLLATSLMIFALVMIALL